MIKEIDDLKNYTEEQKKIALQKKDKLMIEANKLKKLADDYEKNKQENLTKYNNVNKHIDVIVKITNCPTKEIVNVFVGILNAVGHMDNMPTLWNFAMIK